MKGSASRFGCAIRARRLADSRQPTLRETAQALGISPGLLSDIEQGRRSPLRPEKIRLFCQYFSLPQGDLQLLMDLAAAERQSVPQDLAPLWTASPVGDMARMAMRMTRPGTAGEEDWKQFIRHLESKGGPKP